MSASVIAAPSSQVWAMLVRQLPSLGAQPQAAVRLRGAGATESPRGPSDPQRVCSLREVKR